MNIDHFTGVCVWVLWKRENVKELMSLAAIGHLMVVSLLKENVRKKNIKNP